MYYDYRDICDAETRHLNGSCQSGIPLRLDLHPTPSLRKKT